ncbi:MAG: hypothetical protein ABIB71_09680, partial [Candidatus Woesearchaeota archaeon]
YLISLVFFNNLFYLIPLAFYLLWIIAGSMEIAVHDKSLKYFFISMPLFFLFHISYGLGVFMGFSRKFDPKLHLGAQVIKVIKKKAFGKKW